MNITFNEFVAGIRRRTEIERNSKNYHESDNTITIPFVDTVTSIDEERPAPVRDSGSGSGPEEY